MTQHGRRPRGWLVGVLVGLALVVGACSAGADATDPVEQATSDAQPTLAPDTPAALTPSQPVTLLEGDAAAMALEASRAVWRQAPTVVVASATDAEAITTAAEVAGQIPAPLLLGAAPAPASSATPAGSPDASPSDQPGGADQVLTGLLADELERLGTDTVVVVGDERPVLPDGLAVVDGGGSGATPEPPESTDLAASAEVIVLAEVEAPTLAAQTTLAAAGGQVLTLAGTDPRDDSAAIDTLSSAPNVPVVGLGGGLGPLDRLEPRVATARTGVTLPGGGQTLFPSRRIVALYGNPLTSALGVLGEQGPAESVERAQAVAASYEPFSEQPVIPGFEVIATVASVDAGADGDYSNEMTVADLRPYVDAAADAGVYVVLDLQPGRSDFLSQARRYEELLALPHVGLALDPEWRLGPDEVHLQQVGTVEAAEVNEVISWLAGLVRDRALPQKMLLLHQFQTSMIVDRAALDTSRDELAIVIQMDGDGPPGAKLETWDALRADAPEGVRFGWKNFYDEDEPTFSPEQTMAVTPTPWWVSYQ